MNEPKRPTEAHVAPYFVWLGLIAAFVFLVMVIAPAIQPSRRGKRPPCLVNLRNLSVAAQNYASTNGDRFPPQSQGPQELSWRVAILPLIDQAALYRKYHRDKPWNNPANLEFTRTKIPIYVCPDNPAPKDPLGRYYTAYTLLTGQGTAYDQGEPRHLSELESLTQTVLFVEACGTNIVWNEPRDVDVDKNQIDVQVKQDRFNTTGGWESKQHADYLNVAFADGSVHTLSLKIDPEVWKALSNPQSPE